MRKTILAGAGVLLIAGLAAVPAMAEEYKAMLEGSGGASGEASFDVQGDTVSYTLDVEGLENVTMAHIHAGKAGENGPPVVWLFRPQSPSSESGTIAEGSFKASDLIGPMQGKSVGDLVAQMKSGGVYVNVHTTANPGGAIRGQIDQ